MQLNTYMYTTLLLVHFLFWSGQARVENLKAHPRSGPLLPKMETILEIQNMQDMEDVDNFRTILDSYPSDFPMNIQIANSNIDLLPADFFQPYNVAELRLYNSSMSGLPYDLIKPICATTLQLFGIYNETMTSTPLQLTPGGFDGCTGLREIWFDYVLQKVPSEAFRGLDNLQYLRLQLNQIERVDVGFEGIQNTLLCLNMDRNPIRTVPVDAFQGWNNMTFLVLSVDQITTLENGTFDSLGPNPSVVLAGNPLDCCDLQWLQDWYKENPIDEVKYRELGFTDDPQAKCSTPEKIPLSQFDYKTAAAKCGDTTVVTGTTSTTDATKSTVSTKVTDVTTSVINVTTQGPNSALNMQCPGILAILVMSFIIHRILRQIQ